MKTFEIREELERMGKRPNKRLGQNFLIDVSVIHAALEAARIQKGDTVLEVGPGLGVLTEALLKAGASVVAIEKDRAFAARLASLFPSLHLVEGDASSIDWIEAIKNPPSVIRHPQFPWKFISNIPYAISSLLIRKAACAPNPPSIIVILVQKEVADRCLELLRPAEKGDGPSLLSLMTALYCSSGRIIRRVPPRCFFPPPRVDSALLELVPFSAKERMDTWGIDPEAVMEVAKAGFAHPRKMLASNLAKAFACTKEEIEAKLVSLDLNPKIRAEELSVQEWVDLAKKHKTKN